MVNLKKVWQGIAFFIIAFIAMVIMSWIIPPLLDALETIFSTNSDLAGIVWVGVMLLWTAAILIIPNIFIIEGIQETNDLHPLLQITISIFTFIFGIILTIKGWYFIEGLASISQNEFTTILFWIAITIMWFEVVIGIPAFTVMNNINRRTE